MDLENRGGVAAMQSRSVVRFLWGRIELLMILTLGALKSRFHKAKEAFPHNPASIRMYTLPL